ncbi:15517_t:CDS:2 [Funneliformis caledonium]|uniref:15517_t:CDS:1 n=1 Tax=Funneliformis caledonium TaxID=1117310 RepID=A0A9N8YPF0_9GLOM|nr:15517_t:CDS:2 [Funneliformis caledonium]
MRCTLQEKNSATPIRWDTTCDAQILSYVDEDDIKTFHSLSLVNRTWCQLAIRHLWKKPFSIKKGSPKNLYKIIPIILSYLDEQQTSVLKIQKTKVRTRSSKNYMTPPSINYPSYIRQLDFNKLFSLITEWINKSHRPKFKKNYFIKNSDKFTFDFSIFEEDEEYELNFSYDRFIERCCLKDQEKLAFFEYIFKIIIAKSKGIEKLFVEIYHEDNEIPYTIPKDFFGYIFRLKDVARCFSGLSEFTCEGNFHKASLINEIKKYSHEIKKLNICPWDRNYVNDLKPKKDLKELLKVQKNLKSFSFSVDSDIENNIIEKLSFDRVYFDEPINALGKIIYPELEELIFFNCVFLNQSIDMLKEFFKKNGNNLKIVQLNQNNSDIPGILDYISKYCFNLNDLCVNIDNQSDVDSLFKILQSKNNLRLLNVGYCNNDKPKFKANEFMKEFTEIFSTTKIVKLDISNWEISLDIFKNFFERSGEFLKVFEGSCIGDKKELEDVIQSTSELHNRILKSFVVIENGEFKNVKIVWK